MGRGVKYVSISLHFTCLVRKRLKQYWKLCAFHSFLVIFWNFRRLIFRLLAPNSVSGTTPNWKTQQNTQSTIDGKKDEGSTSHQVMWIGLVEHNQLLHMQWMVNEPFIVHYTFRNTLFFCTSLCRGGSLHDLNVGEFANIWQSKRVAIRGCLHWGGGPQVGEVTFLGGVTRLSI